MADELISRAEVEALLFNVSDIAVALNDILEIVGGEDDSMKMTKAERKAFLAQMRANADHTRRLAEQARAERLKREAERSR